MQRLIIPIALILCFCITDFSQAQDPRARRRQLVEDLLRGLIDSQVQKSQQGQRQYDPRRQAVPGTRPGQPRQGVIIPNQPKVVVEVSPQMRKVRKQLTSWNQECGQLIQEIRVQEYEVPQLRPLLADAMKVKANIEVICRKAELYPNCAPIVDDFRVIDADWRMLEHRLRSARGVSPKCVSCLDRCAKYDTQVCEILEVQPQFNRRELQRLATKLKADYDHLIYDLYYVVRNQPNGGRKILAQGKELQTMIAQSSALIKNGSYDNVVGAYKQCIGGWHDFNHRLTGFRDERIRHAISDIELTGGLIREQLWLPAEIDREYLGGLSNAVAVGAGQVFDSISLSQLMECKAPGLALSAAREFQAACGNFSNSITSGAPLEDLEWDFRLFEVQWNDMNRMFREFGIRKVDHRLVDIEASMVTLRQAFGEAPVMNYGQLQQLTANLGAICRQTTIDVRRRVVEPRYEAGFQQQICGSADKFASSVNDLHQRVLRNPRAQLTQQELNNMFVQWRTLKPLMNQCKDQDRAALVQYRSQIEPLMVKLQVVFAD